MGDVSVREFFQLMLRRWYVLLAALLIAAAVTVQFSRDGGSYVSNTTVVFTWPGMSTLMPYNGSDSWSLIAFAETVATIVNEGRVDTQVYANSDAPLYGAGLREAAVVGVRNEGSQWSSSTSSATIAIQIVGRTEESVRARQNEIVDRIEEVTASEQRSLSVPEGDRIEVHVEPLSREIGEVSPSRTARLAAFGAMGTAGVLLGGAVAWLLDRRGGRRMQSVGDRRGRASEGGPIS